MWIDFNQNGVFDASEYFTSGLNAGASGTNTVTLNIPVTASLGNTRIRIRGANDTQPPTSAQACGASNSTYGETEDYLVNIIAAPSCLPPSGLAATNLTSSSADLSWGAVAGASGYEYVVSTNNIPPASGTATTGTTYNAGGLNSSSTYYLHVRTDCGGGTFSSWSTLSFQTLLGNDLPAGAVLLTPGSGCTTYSNAGASYTAGEPTVSCRGTVITQGALVWFKFVAPASGFVKVSTDGAGTTLDTKLGLFMTSDPANPTNLAAFSIIGCDDDNGITVGTASIVFASGLTPGDTYYIGVDHYNGTGTGSFCVSVDDVTTAMIAPSGSCTATNQAPFSREDYTGWATIVDAQGRLIANAKRTAASGAATVYSYNASLNVNTGALRQAGSQYYLDRNFLLGYSQAGAPTTFDLKLYFLDAELSVLQGSDPNASLGNLNVTRQAGTVCAADYNSATGANSALLQTASGSANNVSWIAVNTPGFSNFYIMSGATRCQ